MRLADDEITVRLGSDTVYLRPTLRAAFRLERRHGGFDAIVRAVADGNLSVLADVVRESSDRYSELPAFLERISAGGLKHGIEALQVPVLEHVFRLAGVDESELVNSKQKAHPDQRGDEPRTNVNVPRESWAEHHARLFRTATGKLGWPPSVAWESTPAEILEAWAGRVELLEAIFGSGTSDKPNTSDLSLDEQAHLAFAGIGGRVVTRS